MKDTGTRHTPGPWVIHDGGRFGVWHSGGPSICAMTGPSLCQPLVEFVGPADIKQCEANAHLMASAPELLEILKKALDPNVSRGMWVEQATDLIAKAEGKWSQKR